MLFDIFVNILTHNLAEPAYEADVAQLEYKLVAGEHGLIVRVKGFNHKLPVSTQLGLMRLLWPVPVPGWMRSWGLGLGDDMVKPVQG